MNTGFFNNSPSFMIILWLTVFIILLVIELFTVGLTTIWFAVGALASLASAAADAGLITQIIIFLAVSCILLILTRPLALKYLNSRREKTNYESNLGAVVKLTEKVDNLNQTGKGILNGQEWTIRSENDHDILEAGTQAVVTSVSGVKLIVKKYMEGQND